MNAKGTFESSLSHLRSKSFNLFLTDFNNVLPLGNFLIKYFNLSFAAVLKDLVMSRLYLLFSKLKNNCEKRTGF